MIMGQVFGNGMIPPPVPRDRAKEVLVQVSAEFVAVQEFVLLADELGYPVPSDSTHEWEVFTRCLVADRDLPGHQTITTTGRAFHYDLELRPTYAFALAQHHGIPTRLVDWTRRPLVAAFFAAERALELAAEGRTPSDLAVWALNHSCLAPGARIASLTCPRHQLSFLHAQDGLFLWDRQANQHYLSTGVWPFLDDSCFECDLPTDGPLLRKLTLPMGQVEKLFDMLFVERISRAHLMPALDNISKTLLGNWNRRGRR